MQFVLLVHQNPHADVELPVEQQQWALNVLLDYEGVVFDLEGCTGLRLLLAR
jgi:hypothetical protein